MNTSDQPVSPSDEKLMAYIDGFMTPEERVAFEREHPGAATEKAGMNRLGDVLRSHGDAPRIRNPEFFNRQILREIAPREIQSQPVKAPLWKLWRLAFAGVCSAVAAFGIYKAAVAPDTLQMKYFAEVLSVKAGDDLLTAKVVSEDGITVVWVEGMDKLPKSYVFE